MIELLAGLGTERLPDADAYAEPAAVVYALGPVDVVVLPVPGSGRVTTQWLFERGAADDAPEAFGAAHLVEHLAFGRFGALDADVDARVGALGGHTEGWTDRERAGLGATVPLLEPNALPALLALEAERPAGPRVDAATVDLQRRIIGQELAETLDRPHGPDRVWLDELLWSGGEPWSRHPAGAPTERLDVPGVAAAWAATMERAVLVVAGQVSPPAVAAALGATPGAPRNRRPSPPSLGEPGCEPGAPAARWRAGDVGEGAVYVAWPTPGRDHPDRVALEAIARWLGGARVAIGAGCGELVVERRGGWSRLGTHAASLRRAARELGTTGLDATTLERLVLGQLTDLARARAMLDTRARLAGGCVLAGREPGCLADEAAAWAALTPDATRRAAARWLLPDAATTLAVMPPDTLLAPPIPGIRRWGGR